MSRSTLSRGERLYQRREKAKKNRSGWIIRLESQRPTPKKNGHSRSSSHQSAVGQLVCSYCFHLNPLWVIQCVKCAKWLK